MLITGAARRLGYHIALTVAQAGANVILHHAHSPEAAEQARGEIQARGVHAEVIAADLSDPLAAQGLLAQALKFGPVDVLINSAAVFEPLTLQTTRLDEWQNHLNINLTAPFLLCQAFAQALPEPKSLGMDFAFTAAFIAIARSLWKGRRDLLPWLTAIGIVALATHGLGLAPAWGLVLGGVAGAAMAGVVGRD